MSQTLKDYFELTKPRITLLCLIMAAGGMGLATGQISWTKIVLTFLGTAASVGCANTLNMYLERESDKLMKRTKDRPIASGRLDPNAALAFGIALGVASWLILAEGVNLVTAALGLFAILSYAFVYTPLKKKTPFALFIGAVPGAMPPLMGWTAVTGHIGAPGVVLFLILLVWQIPHTIAISIHHKEDYERAGIKTVPTAQGDFNAKLQAFSYSLLLLPVSLSLVPLQVAGVLYFAVAFGLGLWFLIWSLRGFRKGADPLVAERDWARKYFFASLLYLPILTLGLIVDQVLR